MKTKTTFSQLYSFPGFQARTRFKCGILGDPKARIVELIRRQKKRSVLFVAGLPEASMTIGSTGYAIWIQATCGFTLNSNIAGRTAETAKA